MTLDIFFFFQSDKADFPQLHLHTWRRKSRVDGEQRRVLICGPCLLVSRRESQRSGDERIWTGTPPRAPAPRPPVRSVHEVIPSFVAWFQWGIAVQKILLLLQIVLSEIFPLNFMLRYVTPDLRNTNDRPSNPLDLFYFFPTVDYDLEHGSDFPLLIHVFRFKQGSWKYPENMALFVTCTGDRKVKCVLWSMQKQDCLVRPLVFSKTFGKIRAHTYTSTKELPVQAAFWKNKENSVSKLCT